MKKSKKKLGLDRQTLQQLTPIDLTAANGGTYSAFACGTSNTCGGSFGCGVPCSNANTCVSCGSCGVSCGSCACPSVAASSCQIC